MIKVPTLKAVVVGSHVEGWSGTGEILAGFRQLCLQLRRDRLRDLFLNVKDISHLTVKTVSPQRSAICTIDQLNIDADSIFRAADAALQNGGYIQPFTNFLRTGAQPLQKHHRAASYHRYAGNPQSSVMMSSDMPSEK